MRELKKYQKKAVISLVPSRYQNLLKIEINPLEFENTNYLLSFQGLVTKLRELKFIVHVDKSEFNTHLEYKNIIEIVMEPYNSLVEIAKDLEEKLEEIFGENTILNQVKIKGK